MILLPFLLLPVFMVIFHFVFPDIDERIHAPELGPGWRFINVARNIDRDNCVKIDQRFPADIGSALDINGSIIMPSASKRDIKTVAQCNNKSNTVWYVRFEAPKKRTYDDPKLVGLDFAMENTLE